MVPQTLRISFSARIVDSAGASAPVVAIAASVGAAFVVATALAVADAVVLVVSVGLAAVAAMKLAANKKYRNQYKERK